MRKVLILFLLVCPLLMCHAQDNRQQTAQLNQKAEEIVDFLQSNTFRDSVVYYRKIVDLVSKSLKCDESDRMPNRKGEIKPKFEKANLERLSTYRPLLIDAGLYLVEHNMVDEGVIAWKLYLRTALNPLMKQEVDESAIAAYYLAQIELSQRNFKSADKFADIALKDDETAQDAAEIKAQCMNATMVSEEDSLKYLAVISQLYKTAPNNEKYFAWIIQFYSHPSAKHNLDHFVDRQLEENPHSMVPWILKGEIAMRAKRWDEAIEAYRQADEINPEQVPVIYNIGVCINNKVIEMQQQKKGTKTELEDLLAQSRNYLERVRVKDPRQDKVKWVQPLYLAYTLLGDKIHAAELEPIAHGFKRQ